MFFRSSPLRGLVGVACIAALVLTPAWTEPAVGYDGESPVPSSSGCQGTAAPAQESAPALDDGISWQDVAHARQDALEAYLNAHAHGWDAFAHQPVADTGMPRILFELLPELFPDVWTKDVWLSAVARGAAGNATESAGQLAAFRPQRPMVLASGHTIDVSRVTLTCATCHTGRVERSDGSHQTLVGAPSAFDWEAFRHAMTETVQHPNFRFDTFQHALQGHAIGALYGEDDTVEEMLDRSAFGAQGEALLAAVHDAVLGQDHGPSADFPSVWQQADRDHGGWDGALGAPLLRTVHSIVEVTGDPDAIHPMRVAATTELLSALPAAPYPFDVDTSGYTEGKLIFEQACASCHHTGASLVPLADVGTDPQRAHETLDAAPAASLDAFRTTCTHVDHPDCAAADTSLWLSRGGQPAYVAGPLDGIWARAPYLHNGSVPTLYHLLVPSERPIVFRRGSTRYDTERVGFAWQRGPRVHDTTHPGLGAHGHDDIVRHFGGYDFAANTAARHALLEYLKTL